MENEYRADKRRHCFGIQTARSGHSAHPAGASVLIESEPRLYSFIFDAFSLREPASTSLENAITF
jgi:hypothetical protein